MKRKKSEIQMLAGTLTAYLQRIRYTVIAFTAYVFLLHFRLLTSLIPGIDTEHAISDTEGMYYSWLGIGRQGLLFTKLISGNLLFNPDFAVILALLLLIPTCLLVPFLGGIACGKTEGYKGEAWLALLFGITAVSHPILTEQLYFTLQSAEVVFSFLLLEFCLLGGHFWSSGKKLTWLSATVLLLQLPFSTYQAFVPLFIAGAVGMALLQSMFTDLSIREQWGYVGRFILAFLGGFALNQVISRLFFTSSSYLSEQFYWGQAGFFEVCLKILSHIRDVCLGHGTFYFTEFSILCLVLLAIMLWHCLQTKKTGAVIWQLFLLFAWFASPFYLSILLGMRPVVRAQLVLPFATAATAFLCGYLFLRWKIGTSGKIRRNILGFLLVLLCLDTVYQEASVTSRLYYSDAIRAQGDYALAVSLQEAIREFTEESDYSGVVIFWGRREAIKNPSCIEGDIMGQSFFNWDVDAEPRYYYSSNRIVDFLNSLGSSYSKPDSSQISQAAEAIEAAPCYPSPGSILWAEDAVVVKLSEE